MSTPDPELLARVDAEMSRQHTWGGQPGLAYGVLADGHLIHAGGCGERRVGGGEVPEADTVFRIASMTKSFTAALVLLLRDEGVLGLDDPVARYLPEATGLRGPTSDSPEPTIRMLLTMSGGLPTDDPWGDRQQDLPAPDFSALLRDGFSFAWAPGTAFEYSNLGYAVLGRLIEEVTGLSYRKSLTERLLRPLGLDGIGFEAGEVAPALLATGHRAGATGWEPVTPLGYGAFSAMGGLFASVREVTAWMAGFTDAFPPRDAPEGPHPLRRASRRELQQPHRMIGAGLDWPSLDATPRARATGYGFGLICERDERHGTVIGHSGGYPGFGSHMRWHPRTGLGVVVLANGTYAPASRAATAALDLLLDAPSGREHRREHGRKHRQEHGREQHRREHGQVRGLGTEPVQPAPRGVVAWPQTLAARAEVDRLLRDWDDTAARHLFADNVDADEPLAQRRDRVQAIAETLGPLTPDENQPVQHRSPAHARWWLAGPGGRVRVEILLTPQRPPRVQTLTLTPVPHPPPTVRRAADTVVAAFDADPPGWPDSLPTTVDLDRAALTRLLRIAAARAGSCTLGETVSGDGAGWAGFRLHGERASLTLTLGLAPGDGAVHLFTLTAEG